MRRFATTVFLAACAALAMVPAARAQSLLFDYVGFDYEFPNPNPAVFGEPGSGYVGLGTVPVLAASLTLLTVQLFTLLLLKLAANWASVSWLWAALESSL